MKNQDFDWKYFASFTGLILMGCFSSTAFSQSGGRSNAIQKPDSDPYLKHQLKNALQKKTELIQKCYLAFLERKPERTDFKVKMDWHILSDGRVKDPEIVFSESPDEGLKACLIQTISKIHFPPLVDSKMKYVDYTFTFKKETH